LAEIAKEAQRAIAQGGITFQKFTCKKCGKRQTMDVPNTFYREGQCEECGHITNLEKACGFTAIMTGGNQEVMDIIRKAVSDAAHGTAPFGTAPKPTPKDVQ